MRRGNGFVDNLNLVATPAFANLSAANRPGFAVDDVTDRSIAAIAVSAAKAPAINARLQEAYGFDLPPPGRRSDSDRLAVLWNGPDTWLAMAPSEDGRRDLARELTIKLGRSAALTEVSDAKALLRISGERARAVLARGLPIDLHSTAFVPGQVAISHAAHVSVAIWMIDTQPTFELAVPRSYAASFERWLIAAAAADAAAPI